MSQRMNKRFTIHRSMAGLLLLLAGLVAFGTLPAQAQFAGPALKLPAEANLPQIPTNDPSLLTAPPTDVKILPGDVLTIHLFDATDFTPSVRVSVDGSAQLPLIGVVHVADLTVTQAENLIEQRLIDAGMYKNPQISVQITEAVNQYVTVTGELRGIVPLVGSRRLLDILAQASSIGGGIVSQNANIGSAVIASGAGWPPTASHVITIVREGVAKPIVLDLGTDPLRSGNANIIMQPHDLVIISKVGVVYVLGAFAKQGAIPLDQDSALTLMQATTLSGGIGFEGRYEDLRIVRTEGVERKVVKVNVKRIIRGQDPDPILQADDIVFLPTNPIKAALKGNAVNVAATLGSLILIAIGR
jgi:polysaccharide export outer membrane protein